MHLHFCRATKGSRCLWEWLACDCRTLLRHRESCLWASASRTRSIFLFSYTSQLHCDHKVDIIFRKLYVLRYEIAQRYYYLSSTCLLRIAIEIDPGSRFIRRSLNNDFHFLFRLFTFTPIVFADSHLIFLENDSVDNSLFVLTWMILWLTLTIRWLEKNATRMFIAAKSISVALYRVSLKRNVVAVFSKRDHYRRSRAKTQWCWFIRSFPRSKKKKKKKNILPPFVPRCLSPKTAFTISQLLANCEQGRPLCRM